MTCKELGTVTDTETVQYSALGKRTDSGRECQARDKDLRERGGRLLMTLTYRQVVSLISLGIGAALIDNQIEGGVSYVTEEEPLGTEVEEYSRAGGSDRVCT